MEITLNLHIGLSILSHSAKALQLSSSAKLVLAYLGFRLNDETKTFKLSPGYLAEQTGLSRRTILRVLRSLVDQKIIYEVEAEEGNTKVEYTFYPTFLAKIDIITLQ